MAATAPYMKKCITCEHTVDIYSLEFIQYIENNFQDITECRLLLLKYINNPNFIFDKCERCLWKKWNDHQEKIKKQKQIPRVPLKNLKVNAAIYCCKLAIIPLIVCIVGYYLTSYYGNNNYTCSDVNINKLKSTIKEVQNQFPSLQQSLLKKISGGFSRLKKPGEPFILLLLHDDTNKKNTDCLASYTSIMAKQNIFTTTTKSLWLNGSEWSQYSDNTYNQDILNEKLLTPLTQNEVLILENLQDLPWSLANHFHHLCDTENPHIAKAMYIFEMKVDVDDDLQQLTEGQKLEVAEQTMTAAWKDAPHSFRSALIARLTSFVDAVKVSSDNDCQNILASESQTFFITISPK